MIQFSGLYRINDVKGNDGALLSDPYKKEALREYFYIDRSGDISTLRNAKKTDTVEYAYSISFAHKKELYVAIDDQAGKDGTELRNKHYQINKKSDFIDSTSQVLFTAPLAWAMSAVKHFLYAGPKTKRLMKKAFKHAEPADIVATFEQGSRVAKADIVSLNRQW